jgi:hypothetical protein
MIWFGIIYTITVEIALLIAMPETATWLPKAMK